MQYNSVHSGDSTFCFRVSYRSLRNGDKGAKGPNVVRSLPGVPHAFVQRNTHSRLAVCNMDSEEGPLRVLDIDDACLSCVLGQLSPVELAQVQLVCKRLQLVASHDRFWIPHLQSQYGLSLKPLLGSLELQQHAAAQRWYVKLGKQLATPQSLHVCALSTDGSCDEPYTDYWADHMFTYKRAVMYCSESDTCNIHVMARLCGRYDSLPQDTTCPALTPLNYQAETNPNDPGFRNFLLCRCLAPAWQLMNRDLMARMQHQLSGSAQQQQQEGRRPTGMWSTLLSFPRRLACGWADNQPMTAAVEALRRCSTQGLCEFFLYAYISQQGGQPWGSYVFAGLSDDAAIQQVHQVAFQEWMKLRDSRAEYRLCSMPLPAQSADISRAAGHLPAASAVTLASMATAAVAGNSQAEISAQQLQQHRQLQLLCDQEQLEALNAASQLSHNLCLIQECILSRDGLNGSTCPVRSGFILLGQYQHKPSSLSSAAAAADITQHNDAAEASSSSAADSSECSQAVRDVGSILGHMSQQPWVAACNNMTTASAVLLASQSQLLPPVLDHATTGDGQAAEWIEFAPPTQHQIQQQQHVWARILGDGSSRDEVSAACVLTPVLWFRFGPAGDQESDDAAPPNPMPDEDGDALPGLLPADFDEHTDSEQDTDSSEHEPGIASSDAAQDIDSSEPASPVALSGLVGSVGPGDGDSNAAAGDGQQRVASGAAAAMQFGAADRPNTDQQTAATAAILQPRQVTLPPVCSAAPDLPATATEVAAALGWLPGPMHNGMLAIRLHQVRAANFVCVKLLDCEDVKPAFNRSRGGCNIDMQLVLLRGHEVTDVPARLVARPGGQA